LCSTPLLFASDTEEGLNGQELDLLTKGLGTSSAQYRWSALPDLVTTYQAMGIAFKMLGRKLEQLRIFERFQLMDQAYWNIHALTRV
jgi:hypothetical protein